MSRGGRYHSKSLGRAWRRKAWQEKGDLQGGKWGLETKGGEISKRNEHQGENLFCFLKIKVPQKSGGKVGWGKNEVKHHEDLL